MIKWNDAVQIYSNEKLKDNLDIKLEIISQCHFRLLSDDDKNNKELLLAALKYNIESYNHASEDLKKDE